MKPGPPILHPTRLLDQVCELARYLHYSLGTEKAYLYRVRFFIRWHGRAGGMRQERNSPQRYRVVLRGFATPPGPKRRFFMCQIA
jgi:hypothetical protein